MKFAKTTTNEYLIANRRTGLAICVLLFAIPVLVSGWSTAASSHVFPTSRRCKYSVRDVAFVNVHGKPWQLQLIKPDDVSDSQFESWNDVLTDQLALSNVDHIWYGFDSDEATELRNRMRQSRISAATMATDKQLGGNQIAATIPQLAPQMALTGPDDVTITFPQLPLKFSDQLERLLNSPSRREITDNVVESLCVIVLVESGNAELDAAAHATVSQAIEQVNRQMWTLEKPTDKGPALVTVPHVSHPDEFWLLASLGIDRTDTPAVAIIYGQGRRLGEILTLDGLTVDSIVSRASICGQDCECRLDRDWLYGQQIIHQWDTQHERGAENSLSFDPHSAFVIAEVSQIIRKNSIQQDQSDRILLGSGLVIHDLEPIGATLPEADSMDVSAKTAQPASPSNSDRERQQNESMIAEPPTMDILEPTRTQGIPWALMVGLFIVAIGIFGWRRFAS